MTLNGACVNITNVASAGLSELADEADSKSVGGNIVRVQVPPPAGARFSILRNAGPFLFV